MSLTTPVRNPDLASPAVMTRRAWWLVLLNAVLPGSAQLLAGDRRLGRFGIRATFFGLVAVAVIAIAFALARPTVIMIATNPVSLWVIQAILAFYAVLWLVLTLDTIRLVRLVRLRERSRVAIGVLVTSVLIVAVGGAGWGTYAAGITRDTIGQVFAEGTIEPPVDGRYNILLLGGDAGPDRSGLRPDSISVVSIEADSGRASIIGLPRNLEHVPFSDGSPMLSLYPDGYGTNGCNVDVCLLNSIYTEVELKSADLYPDAERDGSKPGIEAMRDAAEGVTGLTIQYYVLIDMQGFSDLINALGGITIESTGRYPVGGGEDANGQPINVEWWIEPGVQRMDGYTALWYARARHGSSDYDRMERQRQVQEAMLEQFDPANVLTKFQAVAQAGAQVVSTDIPQGMLGVFIDLASRARGTEIGTLELVPPLVAVDDPDFDSIRSLVSDELAPTATAGG